MISIVLYVYPFGVSEWGNEEFFLKTYSALSATAIVIFCSANAVIVQMFLIHRCWLLTKQLLLIFGLILGSIAAAAAQVWGGTILALYPALNERNRARLPMSLAFSLSAVTDVVIALTLVVSIKRQSATTFNKSTSRLFSKIVAVSISTGSAVAVLAVASVIIGTRDPEGNAAPGTLWVLGRVYAISMVGTFTF
ncbi:hypothetical protein VKT23_009720 [Stygiomarasmius scandens]|uniref:DUF6534 domain-containing protein n=1 Tax=Marasmiellus scandens TaxID=2682957 RepID=A0ABR1JE00_9AGAR